MVKISKIKKIYSGVLANNIASAKSMLKIGAIKEGVLKKHVLYERKYVDMHLYSIFKSSFKSKKKRTENDIIVNNSII